MDPLLRPGRDRLRDRVGAMENSIHMIGRLKPSVTLAQAQADLSTIAVALQREYPNSHANRTVTARRARTLHDGVDQFATTFTALLMAIVGIVLLVACVNLANLLLARGMARQRELAVRRALGVTRRHVIRLLLVESLVIATVGGAAGGLLAFWATSVISQFSLPMSMPMVIDVSLDRSVLAFTSGVSIAAALLFGLLPALQASRGDLVAALRSGEPLSSHAHVHARLRASFVVAQVALSVVLLVAAGVVVRSVAGARAIDPGFQIDGVLALSVDLEVRGYDPDRGARLYGDMLERVRALPGVTEAGLTQTIPLTLFTFGSLMVKDGDPVPSREHRQTIEAVYGNTISPRYLATIGIPLIAGRDFTDDDGPMRGPVIIVNETTARRFWPDESAVGKRLREWLPGQQALGPPLEVIGVARDASYGRYGEPPLSFAYRPLAQNYSTNASLLVRTTAGGAGIAAAVEREIHRLDADLPVFDVSPLSVATSISLLPARIAGTLFAVFGGLALVLATIGLYGVMSYLMRQRRREIAIRLALGAERSHVVAAVVVQGMRWVTVGLVSGSATAVVLVRSASALLPGVRAFDPLTLVIITGILAATACAACGTPAWRASCVDPLAALRQD
jgi:predicted permease